MKGFSANRLQYYKITALVPARTCCILAKHAFRSFVSLINQLIQLYKLKDFIITISFQSKDK